MTRILILVCGLHVLISLAWAARQPAAPVAYFTPRPVVLQDPPCALVSEQADFDAGNLVQGAKFEHVFRVTNQGTDPLHIERVESSCGCTVAELVRRDLAPGQSTEVRATFKAGLLTGPFHKTVRLIVQPRGSLVLSLRGRVMPDYLPDPMAVSFGEPRVGQTESRSVLFYPTRPGVVWPYGPAYTIDPEVVPSAMVEQKGAFRVDLTLKAQRPGPKTGVLTLPGKVPMFVRYSARVKP